MTRPTALLAAAIVLATASAAAATSVPAGPPAPASLYDLAATRIDGKAAPLAAYRGKVALVVNTASKCGYTPQYAGLQKLHEVYGKRGLAVLGFPANDFMWQEPGSNAEIAAFCGREYDVTFPMFAKVSVKDGSSPVYRFLLADAEKVGKGGAVGWNFEKFLVSRKGRVVDRFPSKVAPDDPKLVKALEAALAER